MEDQGTPAKLHKLQDDNRKDCRGAWNFLKETNPPGPHPLESIQKPKPVRHELRTQEDGTRRQARQREPAGADLLAEFR